LEWLSYGYFYLPVAFGSQRWVGSESGRRNFSPKDSPSGSSVPITGVATFIFKIGNSNAAGVQWKNTSFQYNSFYLPVTPSATRRVHWWLGPVTFLPSQFSFTVFGVEPGKQLLSWQ